MRASLIRLWHVLGARDALQRFVDTGRCTVGLAAQLRLVLALFTLR
jgi:hypothetical protein